MASKFIRTAADGGVFRITIDRPEKMNALLPEMHAALADAFDRFAADEALRVCVVAGAGDRAFCAGSDLTGFKAAGGTIVGSVRFPLVHPVRVDPSYANCIKFPVHQAGNLMQFGWE